MVVAYPVPVNPADGGSATGADRTAGAGKLVIPYPGRPAGVGAEEDGTARVHDTAQLSARVP